MSVQYISTRDMQIDGETVPAGSIIEQAHEWKSLPAYLSTGQLRVATDAERLGLSNSGYDLAVVLSQVLTEQDREALLGQITALIRGAVTSRTEGNQEPGALATVGVASTPPAITPPAAATADPDSDDDDDDDTDGDDDDADTQERNSHAESNRPELNPDRDSDPGNAAAAPANPGRYGPPQRSGATATPAVAAGTNRQPAGRRTPVAGRS